jgi:alpha-L-fucosidase
MIIPHHLAKCVAVLIMKPTITRFVLGFFLSLGLIPLHSIFAVAGDAAKEAAESAGGSLMEGASPDDPRVAWFREAKYGMFIHWGIYSVAGGVWQGQPASGLGEWIMRKANISIPEYARLAEQFYPTNFNADEWAQLAQDAGMKYMVITAKHHDGFAMFHSKVSAYNVYDATPWKRDPLRELADACAKRGIKLCFYYSHSADWHEPNAAGGNSLDFTNSIKDFDQYFESKAIPQVKELLSNYGPVGLLWFDWPGPVMTPERSQKLADVIHALQPATLINSRIGPKNPDQYKDLKKVAWDFRSLGDNHVPPQARPGGWETAATIINGSWGYRVRDREKARSAEDVCFQLVDVVSKGGNLLLNVGPDGTGEIPPMSQACLRKVGAWLKVNGEAIYGAGPTPFGPEFGAYVPGGQPNKEGEKPFNIKKDWRCTTKPGIYYIHLFNWPQRAFLLDGVKRWVNKAYLLSQKDTPLKVMQDGEKLQVALPSKKPESIASVLALEYQLEQH